MRMYFFMIVLLTSLVTLVSCGKDDGDDVTVVVDRDRGNEQPQQEEQGTYQSTPAVVINNNIVNKVSARTKVIIEGDQLTTQVVVRNSPPRVIHRQYIHFGNRCPNLNDDQNRDGYVDELETQQASGKALLVLDQNLETQTVEGSFPTSNASGNYTYRASATLSLVLAALRTPTIEAPGVVPLAPDEELNLDGRVLIIYGVRPSSTLPSTVASNSIDPTQKSLPLCCTVIQRQSVSSTGGSGSGTTTGTTNTAETVSL